MGELDRRLDKLIGNTFREPEPDVLFHLTGTMDAVEGILSKGASMRATLSTQVRGDAEELRAGEEIAEQLALDMIDSAQMPLSTRVLRLFIEGFGKQRISNRAEVFVSCFTPSFGPIHWERYADNGRGFALGFRVLHDVQRHLTDVMMLNMRVYYDAEIVRRRLRTGFAKALRLAEDTIGKNRSLFEQAGALALPLLFRMAALAAVQTKRKKFDDECEWRTVAIPMDEALPRVVRTPERAYLPFELNPGGLPALSEILLGPSHPNPIAAEARIREVLEARDFPRVPVRQWTG